MTPPTRRRAARARQGLPCLVLAALLAAACGGPEGTRASPAGGAAGEATGGDLPRARVRIGVQQIQVEVADDVESRARGLSGRPHLPAGHGMLFVYPRPGRYGFWMPDMHFDLDLVWIRDGRIVEVTPRVPHDPPGELPTYRPAQPVDRVLEVPAGTAERHGWVPGQRVIVSPREGGGDGS